ncbi:MAG: TVP38/TMEM64 family protein [Syntrophomonas sp.]
MQRLKPHVIIDIFLFLLFISLITYISIKYFSDVTQMLGNPDQFRSFLLSFGSRNILVFCALQVLQVLVAPIPGELVQVAGGYVYGMWKGTIYSMMGIYSGSIIAFYIARCLGWPLLKYFSSNDQLERLSSLLNSQKSIMGIFIIFLIPGIPKDVLSYVAGATPINFAGFFIAASLGRLPGIFMSAYIGSSVQEKHYAAAIVVTLLALLLFTLGISIQNKLKASHNK